MTVGELIDALKHVPGDRIIVMSSDAEGNGYSPLAGVDVLSFYVRESSWSGYLDEDDNNDDSIPCVVVWPRN